MNFGLLCVVYKFIFSLIFTIDLFIKCCLFSKNETAATAEKVCSDLDIQLNNFENLWVYIFVAGQPSAPHEDQVKCWLCARRKCKKSTMRNPAKVEDDEGLGGKDNELTNQKLPRKARGDERSRAEHKIQSFDEKKPTHQHYASHEEVS